MTLDVPVQRPVLYQQPLSAEGEACVGEYSEQVLRLMHSLGIDQHKTIEVRNKAEEKDGWDMKGEIYKLKLQPEKKTVSDRDTEFAHLSDVMGHHRRTLSYLWSKLISCLRI